MYVAAESVPAAVAVELPLIVTAEEADAGVGEIIEGLLVWCRHFWGGW